MRSSALGWTLLEDVNSCSPLTELGDDSFSMGIRPNAGHHDDALSVFCGR